MNESTHIAFATTNDCWRPCTNLEVHLEEHTLQFLKPIVRGLPRSVKRFQEFSDRVLALYLLFWLQFDYHLARSSAWQRALDASKNMINRADGPLAPGFHICALEKRNITHSNGPIDAKVPGKLLPAQSRSILWLLRVHIHPLRPDKWNASVHC